MLPQNGIGYLILSIVVFILCQHSARASVSNSKACLIRKCSLFQYDTKIACSHYSQIDLRQADNDNPPGSNELALVVVWKYINNFPHEETINLNTNIQTQAESPLSGMTNSNYMELNQLYERYREQGLEILAFPCNQFGEEEPGSNDQILDFVCTQFKSDFPIFGKIEVNGNGAEPLYKFLKSGKWGIFGDDIQWNFAKFLVNRDGQPVDRYYPTTSPLTIERDIKKLLGL